MRFSSSSLACLSCFFLLSLAAEESEASLECASVTETAVMVQEEAGPEYVPLSEKAAVVQEEIEPLTAALDTYLFDLTKQMQEMQTEIDQLKQKNNTATLLKLVKNLSGKLITVQKQVDQLQKTEHTNEIRLQLASFKTQLACIERQVQDTPTQTDIDRVAKQSKILQEQVCNIEKRLDEPPVLGSTGKDGNLGFFATGDFIRWKIEMDGTEYAVITDTAPLVNPSQTFLVNAQEQQIGFQWNNGFRVGGGYHMPYDDWELAVNYTHINDKGTQTLDTLALPTRSIFPLLVYQSPVDSVLFAKQSHAKWRISFKNIDLDLSRDYYVGCRLSLRPSVGVKWAWIDQHFDTDYSGGGLATGVIYSVNNKNDLNAFGLKLGLASHWDLAWGFSVFGTASGSLLRSHFKIDQQQTLTSSTIPIVDLDSHFHRFIPAAQLILGLAWDIDVRNCMHFGASVGYENQYWWRVNTMQRFTQNLYPTYVKQNEDLSMHGLTVSVRLDF